MTNSMIPYSFIPGTKAKAGEVNANFIALANIINTNKELAVENVLEAKEQIIELMKNKADKDELINDHTVSTTATNLNDYKTPGTYIFSASYTPQNIPKGDSGTLTVAGTEESTVKQIWYCDGDNGEIFTRNYQNSEWSEWHSNVGDMIMEGIGHLRFPNGLLIQWGTSTNKAVTYPIAFMTFACVLFSKDGFLSGYERSDTGITAQSLTGFSVNTAGKFNSSNWIAIGD